MKHLERDSTLVSLIIFLSEAGRCTLFVIAMNLLQIHGVINTEMKWAVLVLYFLFYGISTFLN